MKDKRHSDDFQKGLKMLQICRSSLIFQQSHSGRHLPRHTAELGILERREEVSGRVERWGEGGGRGKPREVDSDAFKRDQVGDKWSKAEGMMGGRVPVGPGGVGWGRVGQALNHPRSRFLGGAVFTAARFF